MGFLSIIIQAKQIIYFIKMKYCGQICNLSLRQNILLSSIFPQNYPWKMHFVKKNNNLQHFFYALREIATQHEEKTPLTMNVCSILYYFLPGR